MDRARDLRNLWLDFFAIYLEAMAVANRNWASSIVVRLEERQQRTLLF